MDRARESDVMVTEGREFSIEEMERDEAELLLQKRRRCFLNLSCLGSTNRDGHELRWLKMMRAVEIEKRSLWFQGFRALEQLRHWSETVAGPRWRTFLRRFNRKSKESVINGCGCGGGGSEEQRKFRYDPRSYALNFDEGQGYNGNFSARYAVVPKSVNATVV